MRHTLVALVVVAGLTASAEAQYGANPYGANPYGQNPYAGRQAAAPGQSGAGAYRVAARVGGGQPMAPHAGKPFTGLNHGPTISPYLNLFRDETDEAAPNYYTFVRPQQDQLEAARRQQMQLQQLQRQVQQATYSQPTPRVAGGARFGDTGRFYNGWRR